MLMEVVALNLRIVLKPVVRTKIKRWLKEAMSLPVTGGAAIEGQKVIVFREEDVGADKWVVPGEYVCTF
jgi:hypothetical protein